MIFLKRERKIGLFLNFPSLIHTNSPIFYIFASLILKKIVNNTQKNEKVSIIGISEFCIA